MDAPARKSTRPWAAAVVVAVVVVTALTVACADPDSGAGGTAGPATGDAPSIEIVEPSDGETVTVPFDVTVQASVELGPIDEGLHHFHVWFGDAQDQPTIVESDTVRIEGAPGGEQTMWVSLQEADHTPVGNPVSISVTVAGGGAPPPPADY